jgi:hypothetical protein
MFSLRLPVPSSLWRRWMPVLLAVLALLCLGGTGTVLSLSVSGGSNYNDNLTISATVRADSKINNSNFYFEVRAPDGTVVDTHTFDLPSLEDGDSYTYSWTSNNGSYPSQGNYSVYLCWSNGNGQNCVNGESTTTFYSVPTMGTALAGVALVLLAIWLWSVRHKLFAARGNGK